MLFEENHRFGVKPKRGKPKLWSDFHFEFVLKGVASHTASTGFLIRVFPEQNAEYPQGKEERI